MIAMKYFLYRCSPIASFRKKAKLYKTLKKAGIRLILIKENKEFEADIFNKKQMKDIRLSVCAEGHCFNNVVKIELPQKIDLNLHLSSCNHSSVYFHKNCMGGYRFILHHAHNEIEIGEKVKCTMYLWASMTSNVLKIGQESLFATDVRIWGDSHSVLSLSKREVLNVPKFPIVIGKHCWVGACVRLTKGAQIPDDTIVGLGAVVTKSFKEKHTVVAGNPAQVVKREVTWDHHAPLAYQK